jgi:hypothetical protein
MPAKPGTDGEIPVGEYIARFDPPIEKLIRQTRALVKSVAPKAEEKAYSGWPLRIRSDRGIVAIGGFRDHVNVNFGRGTSLDDPKGLLEGTGKNLRHVKVRTVTDARSPDLRALVKQELAGGPRTQRVPQSVIDRVLARVRRICLALPDTNEKLSHGAPSFFYRDKKLFAQVWTYHHDDGRFAMWCAAPSGAQSALVRADPDGFFVPPYVGHRGWLGVMLDRKIDWKELEGILADAYHEVAVKR